MNRKRLTAFDFIFFNYLNFSIMTRLQHSIISICPVLNIQLHGSEILPSELVFQFRADQKIEPLYTMLRKYELDASIDIVENWQFLFIGC